MKGKMRITGKEKQRKRRRERAGVKKGKRGAGSGLSESPAGVYLSTWFSGRITHVAFTSS